MSFLFDVEQVVVAITSLSSFILDSDALSWCKELPTAKKFITKFNIDLEKYINKNFYTKSIP